LPLLPFSSVVCLADLYFYKLLQTLDGDLVSRSRSGLDSGADKLSPSLTRVTHVGCEADRDNDKAVE
jgi:hypothetical protein